MVFNSTSVIVGADAFKFVMINATFYYYYW